MWIYKITKIERKSELTTFIIHIGVLSFFKLSQTVSSCWPTLLFLRTTYQTEKKSWRNLKNRWNQLCVLLFLETSKIIIIKYNKHSIAEFQMVEKSDTENSSTMDDNENYLEVRKSLYPWAGPEWFFVTAAAAAFMNEQALKLLLFFRYVECE
jgi:hypothetical protein